MNPHLALTLVLPLFLASPSPVSPIWEGASQDAPAPVKGAAVGRIVFDGERPELPPLEIDPEKSKGCTQPGQELDRTNRSLIVSKDLGIKNAVITIAVPEAKLVVPEKPIELDQLACAFEPHVVVVPVGATVAYLNSDKVSHNVRTLARKHDGINKTVAPGGKELQTLDRGADKIEIKCDLHPWMNAWVFVTDTPYVAISDAEGKFKIPDLAPGEYKLTVWHERLPRVEAAVVIKPDGSSEAVTVKLAEKKKKRE